MVFFLPLNRYLQYVHLQQLQGLLVMWNSHLFVKKRLNLITRILSGEIHFTYCFQTDIIVDFDDSSVLAQEVGDGMQYCVCVCCVWKGVRVVYYYYLAGCTTFLHLPAPI